MGLGRVLEINDNLSSTEVGRLRLSSIARRATVDEGAVRSASELAAYIGELRSLTST